MDNPAVVAVESNIATFTLWLGVATGVLALFTLMLAVVAILQLVFSAKKDRAFVFLKETIVKLVYGSAGPVRAYRFAVVLENSGGTPTKLMHYRVTNLLRDTELEDDFAFANDPGTPNLLAVVGPGGSITSPEFEIDFIDFELIVKREKHLYVWGWCEYYDVFWWTGRHRTEFCIKIEIIRDGQGNARLLLPLHHAHNGADDECQDRIHTFPPKHPHAWWRKLLRLSQKAG